MPWLPRNVMDMKREFVRLALLPGANRRELCRRFGIGAKAAYALLGRFAQEGEAAFVARSRRPHSSPLRCDAAIEQAVIELRQAHPAWGARKLGSRLQQLGHANVPVASTITSILKRHGLVTPEASEAAARWQRFEHDTPNSLWQIDFKGYFETARGRCHPLTLLDDHSRYALAVSACPQPDTAHVKSYLREVFGCYGLPVRINADNGAPWGSPSKPERGLTALSVWLIRQGITVSHSAPAHPQTNGKLERFHRSLKAEVLKAGTLSDLAHAHGAFQRWRQVYNHERPHEALGMQPPASRYCRSERRFKDTLPEIDYPREDEVLTVKWDGFVRFKGRKLRLSKALHRLPVAFRAREEQDGVFDIYFCHQPFMQVDMNDSAQLD